MSEQLYEAFRIYLKEGLLGVELEDILDVLKNKGYEVGSKKRDETIDAYMKVTKDPVLSSLIPEIPSSDLNYVNIKELYNERKRKMELNTPVERKQEEITVKEAETTAPEVPTEPVNEIPVDPTISLVEDKKRYQEQIEKNIAETQEIMVQEPTKENIIPDQSIGIKKERVKDLKLNQVGYANVVLMSIIVIIIVAILCVFIFA